LREVASTLLSELISEKRYKFDEPWRLTERHLSLVVPIIQVGEPTERTYVLLEEAGEKARISDTGSIYKAKVQGTDKPILVRSGTIIEGKGTQTRAVETSKIIVPHSVAELNVKCIHASHPIRPGAAFDIAESDVPLRTETLFLARASQSAVWSSVNHYSAMASRAVSQVAPQGRLETPRDNLVSSMRQLHEFRKDIEDIVSKMPVDHVGQVGMAVLDMEGVMGLELFDHPDSWLAASKAVARRYADVLANEGKSELFQLNEKAIIATVQKFINLFEGCKTEVVESNARSRTLALSAGGVVGEVVLLDEEEIHFIGTRFNHTQPNTTQEETIIMVSQGRAPLMSPMVSPPLTSHVSAKIGGSWLEQVAELFFRKKASRKLIETLTDSPKSWKQLEDAMPVSPRTLSQRLKEAQDLGLVDKVVRPTNGHKAYSATPQAKKDLAKSDNQ